MRTFAGVALAGVMLATSSQGVGTHGSALNSLDPASALDPVPRVDPATSVGTASPFDIPSPFDAAPTAPMAGAATTEVVEQYCVRCHNARRMTGNLTLESFDPELAHLSAPTAEKMVVKLRAGMMPPPGARRPEGDTLLTLVETIERVVDRAAAADPNPGNRRFQRLNRAEYERVVHELLDLEVDAGRWLPADTYLGNFDNLSAAQGLSTTLLEAYLRAATEVSRMGLAFLATPRN